MTKYVVTKMCFHNGSRFREGRVLSEGDALPPKEYLRELGEGEAAQAASPKLEAVHRGFGKYDVVDQDGSVIDSGLTKMEAQAKAAGS